MKDVCANIMVKGTVQGVGFRYFVFHRATDLGLKGFVRNNSNGTVEIEIEGDKLIIEEFMKRVKVGPKTSSVTDMKIQWKEFKHQYSTFAVR